MKTFKINEYLEIECEWKKTRGGFKHTATLLLNGIKREEVKCCYLNRTWEKYEYQSVIHKLLEKSKILTSDEKNQIKSYLDGTDGYNGAGCRGDMEGLRIIGMIAKLGEAFYAGDQKATNDWKEHMIRAGLENKGLIMPEDWDTLSEDEKEARMNDVIKLLC